MIGTFGQIVFEVSSDKIYTFNEFKREGKARTAKHDVLGIKPVKQYIGPDLERISFIMRFDAVYGINPENEINKIREMRDTGEAQQLIIGGKPKGYYIIESISEAWRTVDNKGNIISAEIGIQLEEYVPEIIKVFKTPKTSVSSTKNNTANNTTVKKNPAEVKRYEKKMAWLFLDDYNKGAGGGGGAGAF